MSSEKFDLSSTILECKSNCEVISAVYDADLSSTILECK